MTRYRRVAGLVLVSVAVGLVLVSGSFGRAHPTGSYRPDPPPAALSNGCWPLPPGVAFDFPHQVRSDADVGDPPRRRLVLQFDVIDADAARALVDDAFVSAGFDRRVSTDPERLVFDKAGFGTVNAEVTPLPDAEEFVVRGTVVLELPTSEPLTTRPVCDQPFSTKRFLADEVGL
jgi:hypothetical protein